MKTQTLNSTETNVAIRLGKNKQFLNDYRAENNEAHHTFDNTVSYVMEGLNLNNDQITEFWTVLTEVACHVRNDLGEVVLSVPECRKCNNQNHIYVTSKRDAERILARHGKNPTKDAVAYVECIFCTLLTPIVGA